MPEAVNRRWVRIRSSPMLHGLLLHLVFSAATIAQPGERIGRVELFGTGGRDTTAIVAALRQIYGSPAPNSQETQKALVGRVSAIVTELTGAAPTDVDAVCCDENGNTMIYVGLAWSGVAAPRYLDAPRGSVAVPSAVVRAYERTMSALEGAVRSGANEDQSQGYALSSDPVLQRAQLELRREATASEADVYNALESASDPRHRAIAAAALGYISVSPRQIAALTRASADPDDATRNNAVRALWVIARSKQPLAESISPDPFISMLTSGRWTDRNKGLLLVAALIERRPALVDRLRLETLDALVEMARWRFRGHSDPARLMLGRIARIPDGRLAELMAAGKTEEIITAAKARR